MDDLENPYANDASAGAVEPEVPQDPVQAAKDEAWLAQFRADNAAAVMEYDYKALIDDKADQTATETQRDFDLKMGDKLAKDAVAARADASADEKKAQLNASRHDEFMAQAQTERHMAEAADRSAAHFRDEAFAADIKAKQLAGDVSEDVAHFHKDRDEFTIMQEQAIAAQRIATDEAKLPHPGDPAPVDPAGEPHRP